MHEAYFFNSSFLLEHVRASQGELSLFEECAKSGLVVPAFRNRDVSLLRESHKVLKEVYGSEFRAIPHELEPAHRRIVAAVDSGIDQGRTRPAYWPDPGHDGSRSVGAGFERSIKQLLGPKNPPIRASNTVEKKQLLKKVWVESREWRTSCVEDACYQTRLKGQWGLQRLELHRAVCSSVGLTPRGRLPSFQALVDHVRTENSDKARALEVYMRWVNQCHWLNFADHMTVATSLTEYHPHEDFIADSIVRDSPRSSGLGQFSCEVELPSYEALLGLPAKELVSIRNDLGAAYLAELRRARMSSESDSSAVRTCLQDYCKEICHSAKRKLTYKSRVDYLFAPDSISDAIARVVLVGASVCAAFVDIGAAVVGAGTYVVYPIVREVFLKKAHAQRLKARSTRVDVLIGPSGDEKS